MSLTKLKKILQSENSENYNGYGLNHNGVVMVKGRVLARIEYGVFGNANIQKEEFKKFIKKYPQFKKGLKCYK